MREQPTCAGCDCEISRGCRWCERCLPVSRDVSSLRSSATTLRKYGLDGRAEQVEAAAGEIVEQLRTGSGLAFDVAAATNAREAEVRRRAARSEARLSVTYELRRMLSDIDHDPNAAPVRSIAWGMLFEFARTVDDGALLRDDAACGLELAARQYVLAERARMAAHCTCGHARPHPEGIGCLRSRCGCMSPKREERAALDVAHFQDWTDDELRGSWPQMGRKNGPTTA